MTKGFETLELAPYLMERLQEMNFDRPTNIQLEAIPEILSNNNVIGRSKTGSGKTLAYLLPILTKVNLDQKDLQAVILAPTQELAVQIYRVVEDFVQATGMITDVFIGNANVKRQLEKLKKQKPQLIVGTPGRIFELAQLKKLKIHQAKMVVVDEADRMLKERETRQSFIEISKRLDKDTQYMFFSATISEAMKEDVEALIRASATLVSSDEKLETEKVEHLFITCDERDKIDLTRRMIRNLEVNRGIVFVNHLDKVEETTEKLLYKGIKAGSLSSDSDKVKRAKVMKDIQEGKIDIIVASDLAARGLDVEDVSHIINLHPPVDADAYVHRAGRTGRMGKSGTVISIVTPQEKFIMSKFEKALQIKVTEKKLASGQLQDK